MVLIKNQLMVINKKTMIKNNWVPLKMVKDHKYLEFELVHASAECRNVKSLLVVFLYRGNF